MADHADQRQGRSHDDESAQTGSERLKHIKREPVGDVIRHAGQHGAVWNIEGCIHDTEQNIGDQRVDKFARSAEIRHQEHGSADDSKGNRHPQHVRPCLSPFGVSLVDDYPHHRIRDRVHHSGDQHNQADGSQSDPRHIGIEKHQIRRNQLKH